MLNKKEKAALNAIKELFDESISILVSYVRDTEHPELEKRADAFFKKLNNAKEDMKL